jgi:hypothetical protein
MVIRGPKTKTNKTKPPLRFERRAQPSDEVSGERYVWYRYKLIRERVAFKRPSDPKRPQVSVGDKLACTV